MDIIDIMLARAMTPQGQTDTYVAKANAAAAKAAKAQEDAEAAIATITAAATDIEDKQAAAAQLLEDAQDALETAQQASINMPETYNTIGQNTDGYMTQKAVTDALDTKANTALLDNYATKQYVNSAISSIPSNGGSNGVSNLGADKKGRIVVVGENGTITAGDTTENQIIESLLRAGLYQPKNAVGLEVNYQAKSFIRTQDANSMTMGNDFDQYLMYGGRVRCNVGDDGYINAFYGEQGYKDDGTNGQVMVYQPKFYYQRTLLKVSNAVKGQIVRQESIIISPDKQSGFKLHPIFDAGNGEEYDYILLSAYEGSINSNKLASVAGVQPANHMTIDEAETYANARGNGWHIMNMAAESANQMLEIIEFGSLNGQTSLESGISDLEYTQNQNCSAITGSTASLGNVTGHADMTISINNSVNIENTDASKRAISYRGMENPWGNMWRMIGGINIKGDGNSQGGAPYICTDFNYTSDTIGENYEYIGFNLPSTYGWISALGYGNEKYDWVLLPAECANTVNSLVPVGDNLWTVANVNVNKIVAVGGSYNYKDNNGPFYYACDRGANESDRNNYSARLMYIPTKNAIYESNIAKWRAYMGG